MSDKARALEIYAKQAQNTEAERRACDVRLRAERRCGELLRELERATPKEAGAQGGRGNEKSASSERTSFAPSPYAQALSDAGLGITRSQSSRWQQVAVISARWPAHVAGFFIQAILC